MSTAVLRSCRFCEADLVHTFVDLGMSPVANRYLGVDELDRMEPFYPLRAYVCARCFLVQLEQFETPAGLFTDYAYFASYSDSWVEHARAYAETAIARFALGPASQVIEIASNDGYLLQHFLERGIPALGIEPAANVAEAALKKGISTMVEFFTETTARKLVAAGTRADLLVGNNVLAHVPALNDFVRGLALLLSPQGVITMEFPHLLRLMEESQFDTIYHEHFSYFAFLTVEQVFARQGLRIFDVEELPTHGGSLRIYACHEIAAEPISRCVTELRVREEAAGLRGLESYLSFGERAKAAKRRFLQFLIEVKNEGRTVVGYGAPAKGTTLLNYCGVGPDFLDYTVDRNPYKQGRFIPGIHVPIHHPDRIRETRPDYVVILPWNLRDEIMSQMAYIRSWGGRFVVPVPTVMVYP
jgi:2-polyprenyl-3-methyl-5-hydroxy-6-metoxy-1,4-benzoquinol methylase